MEYTPPQVGFKLTTLVVIYTDCWGSCKSNYIVPYDHDHDGPNTIDEFHNGIVPNHVESHRWLNG